MVSTPISVKSVLSKRGFVKDADSFSGRDRLLKKIESETLVSHDYVEMMAVQVVDPSLKAEILECGDLIAQDMRAFAGIF